MLTRTNTKQLKAVAILLMLAHHLFTFPERIPYNLSPATSILISNTELTQCIGLFGKICVSIFMFLGGYGLYASSVSNNDGTHNPKNSLSTHIVRLYTAYWKVFLIFIPIGFLFFHQQPQFNAVNSGCKFSNLYCPDFIATFIGYKNCYNGEWWFFRTYLFALFEGYLFMEIFKKRKNLYTECIVVILWHILIAFIFPVFSSNASFSVLTQDVWFYNIFTINDYAILFFIGIIFAKYNIFNSWRSLFGHLLNIEKFIISFAVICICAYTRVFIAPTSFDILIVPVFLLATITIINLCSRLGNVLTYIGKHSTNIWLTHSFYCYYFFPFVKLVYKSKNFIIDYLILLALSLVTSILLNLFWKYFKIFYQHIHNLLSTRTAD